MSMGFSQEWYKAFKTPFKNVKNAKELLAGLNDEKAFVIPHIHHMDWQNHDPALEPVVEIYSTFGSREYGGCKYASVSGCTAKHTVQYALSLGYRLGFVGSGDGHAGRPGKDTWLRVRGARACGITGIYAKELTRDALWTALKARRCYATTGKRIIVKFHLNGHMMGENVKLDSAAQARNLAVEVHGTAKIEKTTIVKNNEDVHVRTPREYDVAFDWCDAGTAKSGDYYYLRIEQADGAMAWSSPIWLDVRK
jgi:hypothetical protein